MHAEKNYHQDKDVVLAVQNCRNAIGRSETQHSKGCHGQRKGIKRCSGLVVMLVTNIPFLDPTLAKYIHMPSPQVILPYTIYGVNH